MFKHNSNPLNKEFIFLLKISEVNVFSIITSLYRLSSPINLESI